MKMKKVLTLALATAMSLSTLVGCGSSSSSAAATSGSTTDSAASDTLCDCAPQHAAMDASKDSSSRMVITLFFFIFSRLSPVDGCTFCKRSFES